MIYALMLTDGEVLSELPQQLSGAMFQDEVFANAYGIYQAAYDKGEKVTLAILQQRLVASLGNVPGEFVEKKLHDVITTGYNRATVKQDALALIKQYKARRFNDLLNKVQAQPDTLEQAIDYLTSEFDGLKSDKEIKTKALPQIVKDNKDKYFREKDKAAFDLDFSALNELIGGLDDYGVTVIAARPSVCSAVRSSG